MKKSVEPIGTSFLSLTEESRNMAFWADPVDPPETSFAIELVTDLRLRPLTGKSWQIIVGVPKELEKHHQNLEKQRETLCSFFG
jgi:hypothetical protein